MSSASGPAPSSAASRTSRAWDWSKTRAIAASRSASRRSSVAARREGEASARSAVTRGLAAAAPDRATIRSGALPGLCHAVLPFRPRSKRLVRAIARGGIHTPGDPEPVEQWGEHHRDRQVGEERDDRGVHLSLGTAHANVNQRGEPALGDEVGAHGHPGGPAGQDPATVQPARAQAQRDGGEGLEDPDPAQELQVDGVLPAESEHEEQCADLHHQRRHPGDPGLGPRRRLGVEVLAVDVAGEQGARSNRHHRCGHQRPDGEGTEDEPGQQGRQQVCDEHRQRRLGVAQRSLHTRAARGQPQQAEQREYGGPQRHGDHAATQRPRRAGTERGGEHVRVDQQRHRRPERQGRVRHVQRRVQRRGEGSWRRRLRAGPPRRRAPGPPSRSSAARLTPTATATTSVHLTTAISAGARSPLRYVATASTPNTTASRASPAAPSGIDAADLQHRPDPEQLQRDVRHRRQQPGQGDREGERMGAPASARVVGDGDESVFGRDRPQLGQHPEREGVDDDRVGKGEEADCPGPVDQSRDGREGVGRVDRAAQQQPDREGAVPPVGQRPRLERRDPVVAARPTRREREEGGAPEHGHEAEECDVHTHTTLTVDSDMVLGRHGPLS